MVRAVSGREARKIAAGFPRPQTMSLDQLTAEVEALLTHERELRDRPQCARTYCDGSPHIGFPFPHSPPPKKLPADPIEQALSLDQGFRVRPHLRYLADRLAQAVADVEGGQSRFLLTSMPPRMGKSYLTSIYLPLWILHKHPDWQIMLVSYSPSLATGWGRAVRRAIEEHGQSLGITLARDAGAVSEWQTTAGGGVVSRSAPGQSLTGRGAQVLLMDDLVKDFASAHSVLARDALWDWWRSTAFTRLEMPSLVVATGTRWHEDDLLARLVSGEYEGNPADWEQIVFPAIATDSDVLGRAPGEPLLSPIVEQESHQQALARWDAIRSSVGAYSWAALYQQSPAPPGGAIFNVGDFRFWTLDPKLADEHGAVLLTAAQLARGEWVDSWDTSFKGNADSDFVVGQRWVRTASLKILVDQVRGRWAFTEALSRMRRWGDRDDRWGRYVYTRLIEDSANGPAIIDSLSGELDGIRPWTARGSKESRYRAVTPEVERGEVLLPHPSEPGRGWVTALLGELRELPASKNDDQGDALAQALLYFAGTDTAGTLTVSTQYVDRPGAMVAATAAADPRRPAPPGRSGRLRALPRPASSSGIPRPPR